MRSSRRHERQWPWLLALGLSAACHAPPVRNDAHELYQPAEIGRDGFVRVLGLNVHFVEAGPTEVASESAGAPLVLIPGAFSTYRVWNRVVPLLTAHHRVVVVDYVGTGDSDKPEEGFDYTVEEEADVVVALAGELGLVRPVLIGVSYGASIALNVAARYPELPSRVVCVEGGVVIDPDVLKYSRCDAVFGLPLFGDIVLGLSRLGLFNQSIAKTVMGNAWDGLSLAEREQIVDIQSSYLQTTSRPAMYEVYRAITGHIDFTEAMERETAPILYLYGEASRYRDVAEANVALFRERRCNVETVLLKDGIHDLQLQFPRTVAAMILEGDPPGDERVTLVRAPSFGKAPRAGRATFHALRTLAPPAMGDDLRPIPFLDPDE